MDICCSQSVSVISMRQVAVQRYERLTYLTVSVQVMVMAFIKLYNVAVDS